MKAKLLMLLMVSCVTFRHASSQIIESNSGREKYFAFEVKNIDEFFERFNYEEDAFFLKYLKKLYPGVAVDRAAILANLFNRHNTKLQDPDSNVFLTQVTDSRNPVYLDFNNDNWLAEALCKFEYKGKLIDVNIILNIQPEPSGSAKWMIAGAYSKSIYPGEIYKKNWSFKSSGKYLNSMCHATNFMSLASAFDDKSTIRDYLNENFFQSAYSKIFLATLLRNQLKFKYVSNIKYHFLQVDGWIFTVDRHQFKSINSGWLINSLRQATDIEKQQYKKMLLRLSP